MFKTATLDECSTKTFKNTVSCLVKKTVGNVWETLPVSGSDGNCFLKHKPNLAETPWEELTEPSDFDHVTARIQSEESWIQ